jgi:hypothetical protein
VCAVLTETRGTEFENTTSRALVLCTRDLQAGGVWFIGLRNTHTHVLTYTLHVALVGACGRPALCPPRRLTSRAWQCGAR